MKSQEQSLCLLCLCVCGTQGCRSSLLPTGKDTGFRWHQLSPSEPHSHGPALGHASCWQSCLTLLYTFSGCLHWAQMCTHLHSPCTPATVLQHPDSFRDGRGQHSCLKRFLQVILPLGEEVVLNHEGSSSSGSVTFSKIKVPVVCEGTV